MPDRVLRLLLEARRAEDPVPALRSACRIVEDERLAALLAARGNADAAIPDASFTKPERKGLSPREAALVDQIGGDSEPPGSLLAAVLADPDEDAPRHVYGDWLSEQGDARGTLIGLQLADQRDPRAERRLIAEHEADWLGPLAPIVRGHQEWERGFLAGVRLRPRDVDSVREATGADEWATVKRIRTASIPSELTGVHMQALLCHPVLRGLERHDGALQPGVFWEWVNGAPRPLRHVAFAQLPIPFQPFQPVENHELPEQVRRNLQQAPGLPWLESLALRQPLHATGRGMTWLLHSPLGERLRHLELHVPIESLGGFVEVLATTQLDRLTITQFGDRWAFVLDRCPSGRYALTARFEWDRVFDIGTTSESAADTVSIALETVAPGALESVTPEFRVGSNPSEDEAARLSDAIERTTH